MVVSTEGARLMCRAIAEGGRRCAHQSSAARVMRRRRARARQQLTEVAAGERELTPYEEFVARGASTYWHAGRLQSDIDAEADRDYARRRHAAFLRSLGLDETGADDDVRRMRAERLHAADEDDPSRAWVTEALASQEAAEAWIAIGASEDELYERTARGFEDESPSRKDAAAASFVIGAVAAQIG